MSSPPGPVIALADLRDPMNLEPTPDTSWDERRRAAEVAANREFVEEGRTLTDVADIADHRVAVVDGEITVRAYRPSKRRVLPAIVHFHGGGFALYSIDWVASVDWCRDVAARADAVVFDVDYRLAPEHPFPTAPEDCYRALEWIVANAAELRIDSERIAVAGESAGANLATVVALMARDRHGPTIRAQLLEIPAVDLSDGHRHRSAIDYADGFDLTTAETLAFNAAYLGDGGRAHEPYASPLRADLGELPQAHVMTAEVDVLRDSGEAFVRRLREAGVTTTHRRHRAHIHGSGNWDRRWQPAQAWRDEVVAFFRATFAATAVVGLRAEHLDDAFGIGVAAPRLSWRVESRRPGWIQTAYELQARNVTAQVESDSSVLVAWPFAPLGSRETIDVRVRVRSNGNDWTDWSDACVIEAGLLSPEDWSAQMVTPDHDEDPQYDQPATFMRGTFLVKRPVAQARLYTTALGVYEAFLNGHVVGDDVLAPGWTSYDHRLRYQTYDVTERLSVGRNVLGSILGDGWFRGRLGFREQRNLYGDRLAYLAQLEIEYDDGSFDVITTDNSWRSSTGPILRSSLYDGEQYDARLELDGWLDPGYDESGWQAVRAIDYDVSGLVAPTGPPVRRTETLHPTAILTSPSGKTILDFGQNLVGRLRFTVSGERGRTITIRHAEILEDGELCVRPLRDAAATDSYTLAGRTAETWEARFTFHGFRYAEVVGWPGELRVEDVRAVVVHSDLERTGWFECSDPLVERLHENVVWSMRGNFLDVPTDCPQRDERLGWTGDIQVFAPTGCFLYESAGFLTSWLADLRAEQFARDGRVPNVVPDVLPPADDGERHNWHAPAAGWGDAAVIVPWVLYRRTGDMQCLADSLDSMCAWVDLVDRLAGPDRLWGEGFQFGDWLDPSAPPEHPQRGATDPHLVATAYFARSAELTADAASLLKEDELAARYRALAGEIRDAFDSAYVLPDGRMSNESQTAYALALEFALVQDADRRRRAGMQLVDLVRRDRFRIGSGFLGTPIICDALCHAGAHETAYLLLLERSCPSWLYPVTMGATTIWERWDSLRPDGSVNPDGMTSFNHYAFGAIADWLHRVVAGLAPAEPGYKRIAVQPCPGGGLTSARAAHQTPYGRAEVGWRIVGATLHVQAIVPPNTTADVVLPGGLAEPKAVGSGRHEWTVPWPNDDPVVAAGTAQRADKERR
jgi:alpha-L-rhamnosidase